MNRNTGKIVGAFAGMALAGLAVMPHETRADEPKAPSAHLRPVALQFENRAPVDAKELEEICHALTQGTYDLRKLPYILQHIFPGERDNSGYFVAVRSHRWALGWTDKTVHSRDLDGLTYSLYENWRVDHPRDVAGTKRILGYMLDVALLPVDLNPPKEIPIDIDEKGKLTKVPGESRRVEAMLPGLRVLKMTNNILEYWAKTVNMPDSSIQSRLLFGDALSKNALILAQLKKCTDRHVQLLQRKDTTSAEARTLVREELNILRTEVPALKKIIAESGSSLPPDEPGPEFLEGR